MYKIVIIGPQGSGKNTQAELLSDKLGIPMISSGDLLREEIEKGTDLGKQVEPMLKEGHLVPTNLTNKLVENRISQSDAVNGFILNGYPRTLEQAEALDNFSAPTHFINLELSDEVAIHRIAGRRVCHKCGETYHIVFNPPKKWKQELDQWHCDKDDEILVIRDDDRPEAIRERLAIYRKDTEVIFGKYRSKGVVYDIDASKTIEEIQQEILRVLEK